MADLGVNPNVPASKPVAQKAVQQPKEVAESKASPRTHSDQKAIKSKPQPEPSSESLVAKAKEVAGKGIDFVKEHPGATAAVVAGTAATGLAIANHEKVAEAGKDALHAVEAKSKAALKVVTDNPVKSSLALGAATYVASKHGTDIKEALTPDNLKEQAAKAAAYAKENPIKAGLAATVLSYIGIKALSPEEEADSKFKEATFETVKDISNIGCSHNKTGIQNFGETGGAIEKIQELVKSLAEAGDPLAKQVHDMAHYDKGTVSEETAQLRAHENEATLYSINRLMRNNDY